MDKADEKIIRELGGLLLKALNQAQKISPSPLRLSDELLIHLNTLNKKIFEILKDEIAASR